MKSKPYYEMDFRLWMTIRRLFYCYGQPFLDNILYVENHLEFEDYKKRYKDFDEEFEKHFSLSAFYNSQVGSKLPLVTLDFRAIDSHMCDPRWIIDFNYSFATISPKDCRDDVVAITNSPEGIMLFKSKLATSFIEVLYKLDCLDMDDCPEFKVDFEITEETIGNLYQTSEMQFGTNNYQIQILTKC